jgi:hypothetical protein
MAEPRKAKEAAATDPINITWNQTNGYGFNPPNSGVDNIGTVQFIAPKACWVWTYEGTNFVYAFNGQQADYVLCGVGGNNNFNPAAAYYDTTVSIISTNVGAPPPNLGNPRDSVKGTIKIGSALSGKHEKR